MHCGISSAVCFSILLVVSFSCTPASTSSSTRVHDALGIIPEEDAQILEMQLQLLYRESGIDTHVLFASLENDERLEPFAAKAFETYRIGQSLPNSRGILFVYDIGKEKLRIEIDYELEEIFPDALMGYFIHHHTRHLFQSDQPGFALRMAIRMLQHRIRTSQLGEPFDPGSLRPAPKPRFHSGGAGATDDAPTSQGTLIPFPQQQSESWRTRFAAGQSVNQTYQRYIEWLESDSYDPQVTLFTSESRELLAQWPMTQAYFDEIRFRLRGAQFQLVQEGHLALLYSSSSPFLRPFFLRRTDVGWQIDLIEEMNECLSVSGGRYTWSFRNRTGEFTRQFTTEILRVDGFLRMADGDNRVLSPFLPGPT